MAKSAKQLRAELRVANDVLQRLIVFDGGAELMAWEPRHRHHKDEPYIGCPFCEPEFVPKKAADDLADAVRATLDEIETGEPVDLDTLEQALADYREAASD